MICRGGAPLPGVPAAWPQRMIPVDRAADARGVGFSLGMPGRVSGCATKPAYSAAEQRGQAPGAGTFWPPICLPIAKGKERE
jgi:hypothetical protein